MVLIWYLYGTGAVFRCINMILVLYWYGIRMILVWHWYCMGMLLVWYWNGIRMVLVRLGYGLV